MAAFFELTDDHSAISMEVDGMKQVTLYVTDRNSETSNGIMLTEGEAQMLADMLWSAANREI